MIKITKIFSKHKVKKSFFPWIIHLGLGLLIMVICFFLTERTAVRLVNIPAQTQGFREYSWHVMAIMPTSEDSYWQEMRQGMQNTAPLAHIGLEFVGPRYSNPAHLVDRFNRAVASRVDGIICHAEDTPAVSEAIQRAEHAGIPVVTVGVDIPDSGRRGHVGPDSFQMGYAVGRTVGLMTGSARIAVILDGASTRPRSGREEYLSGLRAAAVSYPHLEIAKVIYTQPVLSGAEISMEEIKKDLSINVVCALNSRDTLGMAKGLAAWEKRPVTLIGSGLLPETLQLLRNNILQATVTSFPFAMGSEAVELMADILAHRSYEDTIHTGVQVIRSEVTDNLLRGLATKEAETGEE